MRPFLLPRNFHSPRTHLARHIHNLQPPQKQTPSCHSPASALTTDKNKQTNNRDDKNALMLPFWTNSHTWNRASINTLRCLAGCSLGDFSALWILQSWDGLTLSMGEIMGVSMTSGILTSITLETLLLAKGKDNLSWGEALRTACGMSLVSMLAMESVQNVVDWHLTGGVVQLGDVVFWAKAGASLGAGFLAALPYNYWRLRAWGRSCH